MNARETALKTIYSIEFESAYSNMALKSALRSVNVIDKAFVTNMVYGVISRKLTLDYIISCFSKIKLKKISKYILVILEMGIYQLKFMDKVPESAAVNESVKLAKRYGHGASANFVNGVLRAVSRNEIEYPKDRNEYLSVKYSFPAEVCKKWVSDFGYDFTEELLSSFDIEPELTLRPNILKITPEELSKKVNGTVKGISIKCKGFDIENDALYRNGYYTVQDEAAMQAAVALDAQKGDIVIDLCAAPGGKTTHIAELMGNEGCIKAFDIHEHKIKLIEDNSKRLGIDIIKAEKGDASVFMPELSETADRVLCDVPCSGWGIVRKKPDIKWASHEPISGLQKKILNNGAKYLKRNGIIVYSTCTIEREENEMVTEEFLKNNKEFEKVYEKTFYPHKDGTDGFYICKLKRN